MSVDRTTETAAPAPKVVDTAKQAAMPNPSWREQEYPSELKKLENKASTVGLALSGGGIRSATFCLGFLQSLAEHGVLGKVGFMSTVSGGGYIGGFLGALFSKYPDSGAVEKALRDPRSFPMLWLRENGRYLAPNGSGDLLVALAFLIRNWLSVLLVMSVFALAPFLLLNFVRAYFCSSPSVAAWAGRFFPAPAETEFWWWSPWLVIALLLLYMAAAVGWSYWLIPRAERADRVRCGFWVFEWCARPCVRHCGAAALGLLAILSGGWWGSGMSGEVFWPLIAICVLPILALGIYVVSGFCAVLRGRCLSIEGDGGRLSWRPLNCEERGLLGRRRLTNGLSWLLMAAAFALAVGLLDSLGQSLYLSIEKQGWSLSVKALAAGIGASSILALGPKLVALLPRRLTEKISGARLTVVAWVASAGCVLLVLLAVNLLAHSTSWKWEDPRLFKEQMPWKPSLIGFGLAGALVWLSGRAYVFLHTSSLQMLYGFRLARAYLGASNKNRENVPRNSAITDMIPGDDIWLEDYEPHKQGGPIHIINLTFNETCSAKSNVEQRDRKGLQFAVGPYGVSVSRNHHALWTKGDGGKSKSSGIVPIRGWSLSGSELRDPIAFARKLVSPPPSSGEDKAITDYVVSRLGTKVVDKLRGYVGCEKPVPEEIRALLVTKLNREIIDGEPICFNGVEWEGPKRTLKADWPLRRLLRAAKKEGGEKRRLANRLFLQAAFPEELAFEFRMFPPGSGTNGERGIEELSLGHWLAISGAAVGTGLGNRTSVGLSLLAGLANIRLGYWWNSNVSPSERPRESRTSGRGLRVGRIFTKLLPVQAYLLDEWLARFHGPARQYWQLSDGGHFENTGVYELIRRRLPQIICCDCGEDPQFHFGDLANLVRKARTDFQAEITFLTRPQLELAHARWRIPAETAKALSTPEEFCNKESKKAKANGAQRRGHALVAEVEYQDGSGERSLILFVKPSLSGDESLDVREYHQAHPSFPHESTADQFFNEAQWECYRKLGEHSGERLFGKGASWFEHMARGLPRPMREMGRGREPFRGEVPEAPGAGPERKVGK